MLFHIKNLCLIFSLQIKNRSAVDSRIHNVFLLWNKAKNSIKKIWYTSKHSENDSNTTKAKQNRVIKILLFLRDRSGNPSLKITHNIVHYIKLINNSSNLHYLSLCLPLCSLGIFTRLIKHFIDPRNLHNNLLMIKSSKWKDLSWNKERDFAKFEVENTWKR